MAIEFKSVEQAIELSGLRMVVVGGVPSPWGEAAKGFLHIKKIDWVAVRLVYDSEALDSWAGQQSGPVAIYNDEQPVSDWADILMLVERLAPTPSLVPTDLVERDKMLDLARELIGEDGLAWSRRLQMIHAGLRSSGGFPERIAKYLGNKYGHSDESGLAAGPRVVEVLEKLTYKLKAQQQVGSPYYFGDAVTAADVYSATCTAMFAPLPEEQCDMNPHSRAAFNTLDAQTKDAVDPILLSHRDMMYETHLELPLSL